MTVLQTKQAEGVASRTELQAKRAEHPTNLTKRTANFTDFGINQIEPLFKVIRNEKPGNNRKSCLYQ